MKALLIGGGIGGLSAAIALRRAGFDVAVYERAPALTEVGAGISLWRNALAALDRLEVGESLRALGVAGQTGAFRRPDGRVLLEMRSGKFDTAASDMILLVHRAELLDVLLSAAGQDIVRTGAELTSLRQTESQVVARFAGGAEETGDILIGADGLRSTVRAALFGQQAPRYGGYTAYRAVTTFDHGRLLPGETWGRGQRFGQWGMTAGRVYWYATESQPEGLPDPAQGRQARLLALFRGWHAPVEELIAATDQRSILRNDVFDRPPLARWSSGRVALLGDAAHPMTPDMGQGGCQAIEDAVALADCLSAENDVAKALARYSRIRLPRASRIVRESRQAGSIAQWSNPIACWLRERVLGSGFAARKQAAQLAWMTAPQPAVGP